MKYIIKEIKKIPPTKNSKKLLQFTFVFTVNDLAGSEHGIEIKHCIAFVKGGEIHWNCPLNYFKGGMGRKQLHAIPMGTYNAVLSALKKSKHISFLDELQDIEVEEEVIEFESESIENG